jgi:putative restriction endonuclease
MNWLEMSRTPDERPPGWRVGECLWSPRRKEKDGEKGEGTKWAFWETMLDVRRGDVVFHLCGKRDPSFTGFSTASEDGHPVDVGPHGPEKLYRVALQDFTPLDEPLLWKTILGAKEQQLRDYFHTNEDKKGTAKERLFYVLQNGRLQCLNGAYLSHLSGTLTDLLFGIEDQSSPGNVRVIAPVAATGTSLQTAAGRIGQKEFSDNVKGNFQYRCCFPTCEIADERFLIGSHIARWSDQEDARGRTDNGLCLCALHDRAFEVGAFTLDAGRKVRLVKCDRNAAWVKQHLLPGEDFEIKNSEIRPSADYLEKHWIRCGFSGVV